jgi:hypothetical protein
MERAAHDSIDVRRTGDRPVTSLVMYHDGHFLQCAAQRGPRAYTWVVRMDGRAIGLTRTKRALGADDVRALALSAYESHASLVAI